MQSNELVTFLIIIHAIRRIKPDNIFPMFSRFGHFVEADLDNNPKDLLVLLK